MGFKFEEDTSKTQPTGAVLPRSEVGPLEMWKSKLFTLFEITPPFLKLRGSYFRDVEARPCTLIWKEKSFEILTQPSMLQRNCQGLGQNFNFFPFHLKVQVLVYTSLKYEPPSCKGKEIKAKNVNSPHFYFSRGITSLSGKTAPVGWVLEVSFSNLKSILAECSSSPESKK